MRKRFATNVISIEAYRKKKSGNWKSSVLGKEADFSPPVWFKACMAGLLGFTLGAATIVCAVRDLDKRRLYIPIEENVPELVGGHITDAFKDTMPELVHNTTRTLVELCQADESVFVNKACAKLLATYNLH